MMNWLYRILLTFNSTSLLLVVFLIKDEYIIPWVKLFPYKYVSMIPDWISYPLYFLIPIVTTFVSLQLFCLLDEDCIENVAEVEQANNAFLPSYLGYFFVALSISDCNTLLYMFFILFIFTFYSQTLYFNPLFLLYKYHFYYLTTSQRVKIFVITRKTLKKPSAINLEHLRRINNFTFIDKEK